MVSIYWVELQPQFEGDKREKLVSQVVHELELVQDVQWGITAEQELQEPEAKYSLCLQLQLLGKTKVKLVKQLEQEVALEQELQFEIAAEQL